MPNNRLRYAIRHPYRYWVLSRIVRKVRKRGLFPELTQPDHTMPRWQAQMYGDLMLKEAAKRPFTIGPW